ncbi:UPF0149 family protein [Endozoicomonas sp. SCSIO W0465]|uniref:UPF0149 family protein n=1 Tax=Endozoicomonas sp. SCSIO W0465 TaxID=2918516 RepID=UPI00207517E0|nr:UPF0149 family protein [Endozoicomonas sp. SCSIO W0465]USE38420.1 UPF0149 family protein [Endozoicomonas sp. SCSIO W0465]
MSVNSGKTSLANCEFDQQQEKVLSAYLASRPAGKSGRVMTLSAIKGLMFAIANSPVNVPPDRWMALALATRTPRFSSAQQEDAVRHILFNLLDKTRKTISGGFEVLPEECRAEDVYSSEFSRLQEWAMGYGQGSELLMDVWTQVLKHPKVQPMEESWSRCMVLLNVWSRAGRLLEQSKKKNGPDVNKMLQAMPAVAREMAVMCHDIREIWQKALEKPAPVKVTKVGRNDPCPCGSGKKHKKCCETR